MLVCHCQAVSDRAIRKAIRNGACTQNAIKRECLAGAGCGGCAPLIDEILTHERSNETAPRVSPLAELVTVS